MSATIDRPAEGRDPRARTEPTPTPWNSRGGDAARHQARRRPLGRLRGGGAGLPRRHDRQRRVPGHPRVVPDRVARRHLVGAQRLQHRLRGVPAAGRPDRRPARAQAPVRVGHLALRDRVRPVRGGPERRSADRGPRAPGAGRGDPGPGVARARPPGLPRPPARARRGDVERGRGPRRRPGPGARRRARGASGLAARLPRQRPAGRDRARAGASGARREPRARPADGPGPHRRDAARGGDRAVHARRRPGRQLGMGQPGDLGLHRRGPRARGGVRRALPLARRADDRPLAAADPLGVRRQPADAHGRGRLLLVRAVQRPLPHDRVGLLGPGGRPGDHPGTVHRGGRGAAGVGARGPDRRALGDSDRRADLGGRRVLAHHASGCARTTSASGSRRWRCSASARASASRSSAAPPSRRSPAGASPPARA